MAPIQLFALLAAAVYVNAAKPLKGPSDCTFHVDYDTQGAGDGSAARPYQTLREAQKRVREVLLAGINRRAPTVVCIHAGTYREGLEFGPQDSGTPDGPVVYAALPGQNVSISGAVPIIFTPIPADDPALEYLPPGVAASAFVSDLGAAGITDVPALNTWWPRGFSNGACAKEAPLELIVDGAPQTVARWPNTDEVLGSGPGWALSAHTDGALTNNSFYADANASFLTFRDTANAILYGFWYYEWADALVYPILPFVESPNIASKADDVAPVLVNFSLTRGGGGGVIQAGDGARYFVQNSLDALDAPGEYYINSTSARLYYYPPSGSPPGPPQGAEVSVNTTLLTGSGASNVWFVGITIEAGRGDGISWTTADGLVLVNVTVKNVGRNGLDASGSNNTFISGATINNTGCGGVHFSGGGDRLTLTPSGNIIVDSRIFYPERLAMTYQPAVTLDSGAVLAHNEIAYSPHFAVTMYGNDVWVQGNIIHDVTRETFDNAAIYFYHQDWSQYNTTIIDNFFYLNGLGVSTCNSRTSCNRDAIYPDNGNAGSTIVSNVIWQPSPAAWGAIATCPTCHAPADIVSTAVFNDGGRDCLVSNNILIMDGANASFNYAAEITWDHTGWTNSSSLYSELRAVSWNTSLYAQRYPRLARLHDYWPAGGVVACGADPDCGSAPYNNEVSTNVIVNATAVFMYPPSAPFNNSNFNVTNNLVTQDPGWAVPDPRAALNFQLAADSPAYVLGFRRIPTECFGPGARCPGENDWGGAVLARLAALRLVAAL